jgi:ferritin-like metal-binding protein YciE
MEAAERGHSSRHAESHRNFSENHCGIALLKFRRRGSELCTLSIVGIHIHIDACHAADRRPRPQRKTLTQTEGVEPMGLFSKDIHTMDDLFVHTLRDIYYAEKQLVKALPEMVDKATDAQLKQAFQAHLGETKNHVLRLEQVFKMLGVQATGVDCPAIDGIIEEAEEIAGEVEDKAVLNAALVAAAQAAEHYEISRYGTLVAWAKQLRRTDAERVLQQNLDEEKAADRKLTEIAEARLNLQAAS